MSNFVLWLGADSTKSELFPSTIKRNPNGLQQSLGYHVRQNYIKWCGIREIARSIGLFQPLNVILFGNGKTGRQEAAARSGNVRVALSAHAPSFKAAELPNRIDSGEIRKIAIVDWLMEL